MSPAVNIFTIGNQVCEHTAFLNQPTIEKAVKQIVPDYQEIISLGEDFGEKHKENNASKIICITVAVTIEDNNIRNVSFVLKAQHNNDAVAHVIKKLQLFLKEEQMYHSIIPKWEKLYKDVGKILKFAPKAYKFDRDVGVDYVFLEDLRTQYFKNANSFLGFDMEHMKAALAKLAEFHAASACYVEHSGVYGEEFTTGAYRESNRELLLQLNTSEAFLTQLKKWKNGQQYYSKLVDSDKYIVERLLETQKYNPREFNVLNHGDCWANNIMFQYDNAGEIKNTIFIDLQMCKYGSPANDLYYLILSTAAANIKLTHFDYFVRFYYDNLVENLKLLQYHRPLPKLKSLHGSLLKNGLTAYLVVSKVLPTILLDRTDEKLRSSLEDESKLKTAMYTNHKYVQAMADILPWLDNRGLLDWK